MYYKHFNSYMYKAVVKAYTIHYHSIHCSRLPATKGYVFRGHQTSASVRRETFELKLYTDNK